MNRHSLPLLLALSLGSSCKGTEGNVFLDKNGVSSDAASNSDGPPPNDEDAASELDGAILVDGGNPDGSIIIGDGGNDPDGSILIDGGNDLDGSFLSDGGADLDGSIISDGSVLDSGIPQVDCSQNPPVFPSFDRSCGTANECAIGTVQIDCCGSLTVTGINSSESQRFADAAAICNSQFPACGCPTQATRADDGTTEFNRGPAIVQCVSNTCQTTFPSDPTVCGSNLSCDPFTSICVSTSPIGPAIQYACEPIPAGCEQNRTCSCAAASLCSAPFDTCLDSGPNQISCECLLCQ